MNTANSTNGTNINKKKSAWLSYSVNTYTKIEGGHKVFSFILWHSVFRHFVLCYAYLKNLGFPLHSRLLFTLLVKSLLKYASVVLRDPYTAVDYSLIERVQRRFLNSSSFILNIDHLPHTTNQLWIN